jgi:hypothetical protein
VHARDRGTGRGTAQAVDGFKKHTQHGTHNLWNYIAAMGTLRQQPLPYCGMVERVVRKALVAHGSGEPDVSVFPLATRSDTFRHRLDRLDQMAEDIAGLKARLGNGGGIEAVQ